MPYDRGSPRTTVAEIVLPILQICCREWQLQCLRAMAAMRIAYAHLSRKAATGRSRNHGDGDADAGIMSCSRAAVPTDQRWKTGLSSCLHCSVRINANTPRPSRESGSEVACGERRLAMMLPVQIG